MLLATGTAPAGSPSIDYDEYVPITVTWPAYRRMVDAPVRYVYGRAGNIAEFKCEADTGALVELVLISATKVDRSESTREPASYAPESSVPLLSDDVVGGDAEAQDLPVSVRAYQDVLEIVIGNGRSARHVGGGRVSFGVTEEGGVVEVLVAWASAERDHFLDSVNH